MSGAECQVQGTGERVLLVHGSLATGVTEWECQRPLADEGHQLVVPTRRAYAREAVAARQGEDFLVDAQDLAPLLQDSAHVVGHSYGGLVALLIAAARPGAVRSLTVAEPPLFSLAPRHPDVARLRQEVQGVFTAAGDDRAFLEAFLRTVGTPVDELPPDFLDELTGFVPALRFGRPAWEMEAPVARLVEAPFPVLVISGNHHPAFTAMCEALVSAIGAEHTVVEGAGHEVQMVAEDFNAALLALWRRAGS